MVQVIAILQMKKIGLGELSGCDEITPLVNHKARIWTQAVSLQSPNVIVILERDLCVFSYFLESLSLHYHTQKIPDLTLCFSVVEDYM